MVSILIPRAKNCSHPWVVVIAAFLFTAILVAGQPASVPPTEYIINGFKDGRDRLRTGVFRATGTFSKDKSAYGRLEGPLRYVCAFDFDKDCIRFEAERPVRQVKAVGSAATSTTRGRNQTDPIPWHRGVVGGKFLFTPKHMVYWLLGANSVIVKPPHVPPPALWSFDVRTIGLSSEGGMTNYEKAYTVRLQTILECAQVRCRRDGNFLIVNQANQYITGAIWFDPARDYTPVRTEFYARPFPGQPLSPEIKADLQKPIETSSTEWQQINGMWVPKSTHLRGGRPGQVGRDYDLKFEWESVNQPIPDEVFTVEGLGLPDGTVILSQELGPNALTLGRIGDKRHKPYTPDSAFLAPHRFRWLWVALGVAVAVATAAGGYWWYRRRRRTVGSLRAQ